MADFLRMRLIQRLDELHATPISYPHSMTNKQLQSEIEVIEAHKEAKRLKAQIRRLKAKIKNLGILQLV